MQKLIIFGLLSFTVLLRLPAQSDLPLFITITEEHRFLKNFEGKWRLLYKSDTELGDEFYGKGISENSIIMGWKYLQIKEELGIGGIPTFSIVIIGYDPSEKLFSLFAIDNFSLRPVVSKGVLDSVNKELKFIYEYFDNTKNKIINQETILRLLEPSKYSYIINIIEGDKKRKLVEKLAIKIE